MNGLFANSLVWMKNYDAAASVESSRGPSTCEGGGENLQK